MSSQKRPNYKKNQVNFFRNEQYNWLKTLYIDRLNTEKRNNYKAKLNNG